MEKPIDLGVKLSPKGAEAHARGNRKDVEKVAWRFAAIAVTTYGAYKSIKFYYEKACKATGLNTKDNPHNNELGPRYSKKETSRPTPPAPSIGGTSTSTSLPPTEPHPWKRFRGGGVPDDGIKTPLQGHWIVKERNTIIYSPSNVGKSVLAGQMALDIAQGKKSEVIPMDKAPSRQYVMYYDIEKNGGDFNGKYLPYINAHPDIKEWIEIHGWTNDYESVLEAIYEKALAKGDTVVFIDNVTALLNGKAILNFQALATQLTQYLKAKKGITLTFVLIMHTKDSQAIYAPLEFKDDIKDDGNLSAIFAENIIGLGMTTYARDREDDKEIIRIKACKNKSGITSNPVIVARKVWEPYLHFEQIAMCDEQDTISKGAKLPNSPHPHSASTRPSEAEEPSTIEASTLGSTRFSPLAYGELSDTEKLAIYQIVKMEIGRGTKQKEIAERLCALGPVVSEVNVSNIKKDTQDNMPKKLKKLKNNANMDEVNKLRELYSFEYKLISG